MKYWKEVLILVLVLVLFLVYGSRRRIKQNLSAQREILALQSDSVDYYKLRTGELVSQKQAFETDKSGLEENLSLLRIDKKRLVSQVGKLDNLVSRLRTDLSSAGAGRFSDSLPDLVAFPLDTLDLVPSAPFSFDRPLHWGNGYLTLTGRYKIIGTVRPSSGGTAFSDVRYSHDFSYSYEVGLTSLTYWKRERKWHFWKPALLVTDISVTDPHARAKNIESLRITPPRKSFFETGAFKFCAGAAFGWFLTR